MIFFYRDNSFIYTIGNLKRRFFNKIIAVKFHLENESSFVNTCKICNCSEISLKRWIEKYNTQYNITRTKNQALETKLDTLETKLEQYIEIMNFLVGVTNME